MNDDNPGWNAPQNQGPAAYRGDPTCPQSTRMCQLTACNGCMCFCALRHDLFCDCNRDYMFPSRAALSQHMEDQHPRSFEWAQDQLRGERQRSGVRAPFDVSCAGGPPSPLRVPRSRLLALVCVCVLALGFFYGWRSGAVHDVLPE